MSLTPASNDLFQAATPIVPVAIPALHTPLPAESHRVPMVVEPLPKLAEQLPVTPLAVPPAAIPQVLPQPPAQRPAPISVLAEKPAAEPEQGRGVEPTATSPPRPTSTRYASLDLWRGAACLMLLCYHSTFYADVQMRLSQPATWSWAGIPLQLIRHFWCGVPIFFVISGYCIAASIHSLRKRPHSLRDYVMRRIRRIYPPLWSMCAIVVAFTLIVSLFPGIYAHCLQLPRLKELSLWQWFGNLLAAESWRHNVVGGEPTYLLGNTWTLCYEEQFYLVTGLMLAFAPRRFFHWTAIVTATVVVLRCALMVAGVSHDGFFWDGHWLLFAAGILMFHAVNYQERKYQWCSLGVLGAGMAFGIVERLAAEDYFHRHLGEYLFVACGFAALMIVVRRWDQAIAGHWLFAPLRWSGQRSYSIYLTHFPIVVLVTCLLSLGGLTSELAVAVVAVPVAMLISLPIAEAFYRLVEQRFINRPVISDR